jgi:hypothetical protein
LLAVQGYIPVYYLQLCCLSRCLSLLLNLIRLMAINIDSSWLRYYFLSYHYL